MARAKKKVSPKSSLRARKPKRPSGKKNTPSSRTLKKSARSKSPARKRPLPARRVDSPARFLGRSSLPSAYEMPPVSHAPFKPAFEIDRRLPDHYGVDRLTLLVRDPWWVFAYWEVTPGRSEHVLSQMPSDARDARATVLRMYDLTGGSFEKPAAFFDIELRVMASQWYVDTGRPDREWGAEIGFRLPDGRFWPLVRSNRVHTPRFGFSDVLDEEWMIPDEDFWKLVGGGFNLESFGVDSAGFQRRAGEYFLRTVSSDGSSQFSLKAAPPADKGAH